MEFDNSGVSCKLTSCLVLLVAVNNDFCPMTLILNARHRCEEHCRAFVLSKGLHVICPSISFADVC
jgi:hypothetical protein